MPDRPDCFADDSTGASERRAEPAHGGERGGSRSTERGFIPLSASKYCYLDGGRNATRRDARCTRAISSSRAARPNAYFPRTFTPTKTFPLRKSDVYRWGRGRLRTTRVATGGGGALLRRFSIPRFPVSFALLLQKREIPFTVDSATSYPRARTLDWRKHGRAREREREREGDAASLRKQTTLVARRMFRSNPRTDRRVLTCPAHARYNAHSIRAPAAPTHHSI